MGFLKPHVPKPPTPANTPTNPLDQPQPLLDTPFGTGPSSLISTSPSGLKRKANTLKTSLIGG